MRTLDTLAVEAAQDADKTDKFIEQYKNFILKNASRFSGRKIATSDDEWAIALYGFSEALKNYSFEKGSFLRFAELIIKRRMLDYSKRTLRYSQEIAVSPHVFEGDCDEAEDDLSIVLSVQEKIAIKPEEDIQYEIEAITEVFAAYGFTFFDLASCSPKAGKTKQACAQAIVYILENPLVMDAIKASKLLPIKIIEKNTKVPQKILERHRKYIIAAVEILSGEYPCLAEYMRPLRKELER